MGRNRAFLVALFISTLFHLSMVTVFSIGIEFPREDIEYFSCEIVDPAEVITGPGELDGKLQLPSADDALAGDSSPIGAGMLDDRWSGLPAIEFPTLDFAQLDRLKLRDKGHEIGSRYRTLLQPEPDDSWARFGKELHLIGSALSDLIDSSDLEEEEDAEPVSRPAAGFRAYVEWLGEPKDRKVVSVMPIEALWGVEPEGFGDPVILVFKVNAKGRVIEILSPVPDDQGIITGAEKALLKYRFEPLEDGRTGNQQGTFIIVAAPEDL